MTIHDRINITANGNFPSDAGFDWPGGSGTLDVEASNLDGATVTLQRSITGTRWYAVGEDTTLTAEGAAQFSSGPCKLRVNVAGGGGSLSIGAIRVAGSHGKAAR